MTRPMLVVTVHNRRWARSIDTHSASLRPPNDFCQPNRGRIGKVCLRPVGTRGGRGEGWGPRACPAGMTSGLGSVRSTGLIPTRTSTRPPHPPHPTPCPYRMQDAGAASVPMGMITPFGWQSPSGVPSPFTIPWIFC